MREETDAVDRFADGARRFGIGLVDLLVRYFAIGLLIVSWIGAAFLKDLAWPAQAGEPAKPAWMFWLALGITVAGIAAIILQARDTTKNGKLRARVQSLSDAIKSFGEDYRDMWTFVLYRWASELAFDGSNRVSLYKHEGDHFIMIARFSAAKPLARRGRSVYPDNQGCIGTAWRAADGRCLVDNLPNPDTQAVRYRNRQTRDWQLTEAVATNLTMKSRSIYAMAVIDDGGQRHAIAVFESLTAGGLDVAAINGFMEAYGNEEANRWMAATKNQLPSLKLAQEEGL